MKPALMAAYLLRAAALLEQDGWCQGMMHKPGQGHCAEGAIAVVTGYHHMTDGGRFATAIDSQVDVWAEVVVELKAKVDDTVAWWNDTSGRTREEVVAAMRDLAHELGQRVPVEL